ncbi:MAG: HAMP domain-containing histidine kinase [Actinobacteria bacterium]|nr:HAMP domain-containing histidine kinase [Actinomycetota bacterium]
MRSTHHHRGNGRGWRRGSWPLGIAWVDVAWVGFSLLNLAAILVFGGWETIPFHFIWISLTLLYGYRVWSVRPTLWVLAVVMAATFAAILLDVLRGLQSPDELNEVPLMAAMFWMMVWHAQRRLAADTERDQVSMANARLVASQRRFLQDASHQLRTPITIALGHAELLAGELAGRPEARDIEVVVGELARLRRLGERLLVIAAAEDPDFLRAEPVSLDRFTMETLRKWMPTARRRWQVGGLAPATVQADRERLGLALDALLENAVRHTGEDDTIQLSVTAGRGGPARMIVSDTGAGIPATELEHVFDRFRTGSGTGTRGTGLGLSLVRAVAHAHGGDVRVRSTQGAGSEFELMLPLAPASGMHGGVPDSTVPERTAGEDGVPAAGLREDQWTSRLR